MPTVQEDVYGCMSPEKASTLMMWVGSGKTEQRLAVRAKVSLLASEGLSLRNIAEKTGLNWQSCLRWRKRFLEQGLDGFKDKQGRGRPQEISPDERVRVVELACTIPPDGSTRWSVRKLAEVTGRGKSTVRKILFEAVSKSHKTTYCCGKSPDPEFQEKQAAIVGLYLNPPENALVLSVDERSLRYRPWTGLSSCCS